ncbi:MAG: dihydrolipoyl dehydrogenase [Legionellales bacterium]|nr:dihydrolipoyl dehydrogenase [Legionellales bacterium]
MAEQKQTQVVVLGSGPGGYTAAFRAADLGKKVILVERFSNIGGVCLNVGCIPSKALLHVAKVIDEADALSQHGVKFGKPQIDPKRLVSWKDGVVKRLTGGLAALAKQRKVEIMTGEGQFIDDHHLKVTTDKGDVTIEFEHAIIAAGSEAVRLPFIPEDPRIFTSTGALQLPNTQCNMLVIGGGIIGLEMANVYHSLGAKITIVEFMNQLMPGADVDIVKPLHKRVEKRYQNIWLETKVTAVEAKKDGLYVTFEGKNAPTKPQKFDQILLSVGRSPNGHRIGADKAGVQVDERGFIAVDHQLRTNVDHIFAVGDIVGQPMLAHKSIPQGKIAAEVIAGMKHYFEPRAIASVAYTDPEVAWVGLTETQAKAENIPYEKGVFPWAASGRALSNGREEGITKLLFDPTTQRVLGAGIIGTQAGDLIAEVALAIEMGCDAQDIALTIHPHPTLAETVAQAAEAFEGTITDLYLPKKKKSDKQRAA